MDDVFMYSKAFSATQIDSLVKATGTTALRQQKASAALTLYPSPITSGELLNITLPTHFSTHVDIQVYNLAGQSVLHQNSALADRTIRLKCDLAQGQYVVLVRSDSEVYAQRLLVK